MLSSTRSISNLTMRMSQIEESVYSLLSRLFEYYLYTKCNREIYPPCVPPARLTPLKTLDSAG